MAKGSDSMNTQSGILIRALVIAVAASLAGLGSNVLSEKPLPWVYVPPQEILLEGVRVTLIDEKEARRLFDEPSTIFLDTRKEEDYRKGHVKGALLLPPHEKEERFPSFQPLFSENSRLILYCYGPECDMAEQVGSFLVQLGYKNMMIMTAGFRAWEKAGNPVESKGERD